MNRLGIRTGLPSAPVAPAWSHVEEQRGLPADARQPKLHDSAANFLTNSAFGSSAI